MEPADRRFYAGLLAAVASVALLAYTFVALRVGQPAQAPYVQPSVPSLIPPPLSCLCGTTRTSTRPFNVVCPYCRNTLSVQSSAVGSTASPVSVGAVAKPATK